jgi:hypothetical protein
MHFSDNLKLLRNRRGKTQEKPAIAPGIKKTGIKKAILSYKPRNQYEMKSRLREKPSGKSGVPALKNQSCLRNQSVKNEQLIPSSLILDG